MRCSSTIDLAGQLDRPLHYVDCKNRINALLDRYLSLAILRDRLEDLPAQFERLQPRPWKPIDWQAINDKQIVGIEKTVFLSILKGAIDTEAPIRGYTQTSRQYLDKLHPPMARFVGGNVAEDGTMLELGLWEKEERQHAPALIKVYQQLSGTKFISHSPSVKPYEPTNDPYEDLYRHGLHRVMTEYGATCLYLWLMAHSTGALQQVLGELLVDEVNHMTKFWGFGVWLFPDSYAQRIKQTFIRIATLQRVDRAGHLQSTTKLSRTFHRMMDVLGWHDWSWTNKVEFVYTFIRVMNRLLRWNATLTPDYLAQILGKPTH